MNERSARRASRPAGIQSAAGAALVIALSLVIAWGAALAALAAGRDWNARANDAFFRLRYAVRGSEKVQRTIAHVDLTDAIVDELEMRNGDRGDFARLVRVLSAAGVSSTIFDISFPARGTPEGDTAFARETAAAGNVYLPAILRAGGSARGTTGKVPAGLLWHPRVNGGSPVGAASVTWSYPDLAAAARGTGMINSDPDPDGVYRRMPLLATWGDGYLPGLALRAACDILSVDPSRIEVTFGSRIRLPGARMPDGSVRDVAIPVDAAGRTIVDYAGPWASSFPHYSMAKVLQAETDADLADSLAGELDGAHVIVSDLTTAASDYGAIPLERVYPRSGIHANLLNSILSNRFLRDPSWAENLLLTLAFGGLLWVAMGKLRPLAGSLAAIGAWLVVAAVEVGLFFWRGVLPALAAPTLALVLALVVVNAWRFFQADRERLRTRSRMERYFAPKLLSRILEDRDRLMCAEQKVVTILFSDISGFTSWCTTQAPETIHRTLNEYFEQMAEIVFRNEGTIDKFIGDGLMAFFGDPLSQPDHALRAVRTGIQMQQAVRVLRTKWEADGRMPIHIRVGINSGDVVVGDMGSRRIMAYTAIGSHVNLASRLEGKAPVDGVLVSAPVYEAVKNEVSARFAGRITAKGISQDFDTYEVTVP